MASTQGSVLNFNVGVLGHVDSGKTSLAKAMSTTASTASFDKNPQSRERGITLDLGFSSFCVDLPEHLAKEQTHGYTQLQFTLVDCPGHASLIRTIIGGAQIIDLMLLVVDVTKGIQTQTAECLLIGQMCCQKMLVILNKIDLLPKEKRESAIEKMSRRLHKTLESTCFKNCPIIPVAARPGGAEGNETPEGVASLIDMLKSQAFVPERDTTGPLIYAVDHCFSIRGQGTVMTGTVLSGAVAISDVIEIPSLKVTKKVKSMQMFRKPVSKASQGDRVGICVTQFDPKDLERGLVCSPGALPTIEAAIIDMNKVTYYKGNIQTKSKFHISLMHDTVMARVSLFGYHGDNLEADKFDLGKEYMYLDQYLTGENQEVEEESMAPTRQFALLEFEHPVTCSHNCLVIGSRLDADIHTSSCRLAFHGKLLLPISDPKYPQTVLPSLKVYKNKKKEGVVERKTDEYTVVCRGLFKKETNMEAFVGLKVTLSTGEQGQIEGSFGQSGKFKVRVPAGLKAETSEMLAVKSKKSKGQKTEDVSPPVSQSISVSLNFRRYMYDPHKKMTQT